jgi:hypothetical protein
MFSLPNDEGRELAVLAGGGDFDSPNGMRNVDVGIFDYAHIPLLYLPFNALISMNVAKESTDGFVKAEARGMGEGAARKVLESMDLSELAKNGT